MIFGEFPSPVVLIPLVTPGMYGKSADQKKPGKRLYPNPAATEKLNRWAMLSCEYPTRGLMSANDNKNDIFAEYGINLLMNCIMAKGIGF